MSLENLPGFPGAGTLTLPADEARPFTIHELVKPRFQEIKLAIDRNGEHFSAETRAWTNKLHDELSLMLLSPDRNVTPDDFTWAATARCRCGAGFCYPKFTRDSHGAWFCSAILLGTAAADSEHDKAKPFAFWSIKSDEQPSANGASTRVSVQS